MSDFLFQVINDNAAYIILCEILSLLFRVLIMLALGFECKSKGVAKTKKYMAGAFFFPVIAVIVYLFNLGTYKKDAHKTSGPQRIKNEKSRNVCIIVLIIISVISIIANAVYLGFTIKDISDEAKENAISHSDTETGDEIFSENDLKMRYGYQNGDDLIFYDKNGKSYKSDLDVPFFDSTGEEYIITSNENYEIFLSSEKNNYLYFNSYVTEDGILIYDDDESFKMGNDAISYISDDNRRCFAAMDVSWNNEGRLVDNKGQIIT